MNLAVCAVFKNEAPFLLEWIAYHRAIGFDRFFLYDNGSKDGGTEAVLSSALAPHVRITHWPQRPAQLPAYRHFIYNHAPGHDWAAFIDIDEFLLPLEAGSIRDLLPRWESFSAVLAHWRVFGPSGWEVPPKGLAIESYVFRTEDSLPVNRHIKSIVKCCDLLDVTPNPHQFQVKGFACDTRGDPVPLTALQPEACHDVLVVNHYMTRSRHDWNAKIRRGSAMLSYTEPKYRQELFDHLAEVSHVRDETIQRFTPQVEALLCLPDRAPGTVAEPDVRLVVTAHIQHVGDVAGTNGEWLGKRGGGWGIEGFSLSHRFGPGAIEYRALLHDDSATPWMTETYCGTSGLGLPMRGFAIRATANGLRCEYAASFADGSAMEASEGWCRTTEGAPLEAMRVCVTEA